MNLVPWKRREVGRPASTLRDEMNRLFDSFFSGDLLAEPFHGVGAWAPALDVSETDDAVMVKAELPGIEANDVEVMLKDDVLTIKGEKKEEKEEKTKNFHRVERSYGSFQRSVRLPAEVIGDKVEAKFKNGVLTIELPKAEESKTKSVKIKVE